MTRGDIVRNKRDHRDTATVLEVQRNIVPGYGIGYRIKIMQEGFTRWEPANKWEVIKGGGRA